MSKSWLLTYNDEVAEDENKKDYGWQNPILSIEGKMTHVFTGSIKHIKNFTENDTVYIYGGGKRRENIGKNGIYAKGTVTAFVDDGANYKFAVIKVLPMEKKEFPLMNGSVYYKNLKKYLDKARLKQYRGCCELDNDIIDFIEGVLKSVE